METMMAMVIHEKKLKKRPYLTCLNFCTMLTFSFFQVRKYTKMRTTSATNTSHSTNHAPKNTRIKLAMEAGLTSEAENQIPTPVMAPMVVVIRKATNKIRYANESHFSASSGLVFRRLKPLISSMATTGISPTAKAWLMTA